MSLIDIYAIYRYLNIFKYSIGMHCFGDLWMLALSLSSV